MRQLAEFGRQITALRGSIILAALIALVFAAPDQMHEVYRCLAQYQAITQGSVEANREIAQSLVAMVVLGLVIWFAAKREAGNYVQRSGETDAGIGRSTVLAWAPAILAVVPLLGLAAGIYLSRVSQATDLTTLRTMMEEVFTTQYKRDLPPDFEPTAIKALVEFYSLPLITFSNRLSWAAGIVILVAAVIFYGLALLDRSTFALRVAQVDPRLTRGCTLALALLIALLIGLILASPVRVPQSIGVIALIAIFFSLLVASVVLLQIWGDTIGMSLLTFVGVYFLVLAASDHIIDNHKIRTLADTARPLTAQANLKDEFERWYKSRRLMGPRQKFPLYVVAAEGGGIYAATHAASFLAEIQDMCPGFSHHLFAISGVSGGSVGAAVFNALTRDFDWSKYPEDLQYSCMPQMEGKRATSFSDAANAIFQHDLWSPLAAAMLFPDFAQRFLPVSVPALDRARSLEFALEEAYSRGVSESNVLPKSGGPPTTLGAAFSDHWDPVAGPHSPALLINTTEVETGRRRVISPFVFSGSGLKFFPIWDGVDKGIRLPLSTAAIASARFPWVTPAASFSESTGDKGSERTIRLVDGGYFENSGVATAIDLVEGLINSAKALGVDEKIDVNLIVFSSIGFTKPERNFGFGEFLEPMRTMLSTWSARGDIEIEKARIAVAALARDRNVSAHIIKLDLQGHGYPLPLGWRLSEITRHIITHQSGALPSSCTESVGETHSSAFQADTISAGCAKLLIYKQIRPAE